ncbi:signal transduction histidine kinase SypF [Vibrio ponticus]|uniref:Hpt domain-containing protein n=1 Tax=Vibrio rhodolitus TaxID=2231649 RepID=UPI0005024E47|nr:Hpt domain-containing protein [Vibrio rhodolitus]GAK86842.1 signal transduction histidine kinase SypF [Vibrio ponticus]
MDIELVDEAIIQQMIEDTDSEVMPMLIDHYIEETRHRTDLLDQAFTDKDFEVIKFESHTLGSTSLALGNRVLSSLARKIEHLCVTEQLETVLTYHQELLQVVKHSIEALQHRKEMGFS